MATFRGNWSERLGAAFAAAALFALLAPTAGFLVDTEFAGWAPNHGHEGWGSVLTTHHHPYDDHHAAGAGPETEHTSNVTFTPADEAGVATMALPTDPASLPATVAPKRAAVSFSRPLIGVSADLVPTPPPRA